MPFDSGGNFSLVPSYLAVVGQTIQPVQHNPVFEDVALAGLSAVLVRDGRAPMTGNLNMGGFKQTNMAAGTLSSDGINFGQIAWEKIGVYTPVAAANVSITNISAYRRLRMSGFLTVSAATGFNLNFSINNGSTYDTGANYSYVATVTNGTTTSLNQGSTNAYIVGGPGALDAGTNTAFEVTVEEFNQNSLAAGFAKHGAAQSGVRVLSNVACYHGVGTARNALRVSPSSGTITGFFILEGIRG